MKPFFLPLILLLASSAHAGEIACPADQGCVIGGAQPGAYHLVLPDGWTKPARGSRQKLLVFFHGHRGTGKGVLANRGLVASFMRAGYAVLAPDGAIPPGRDVRGWPARPVSSGGRDDIAFVEAVLLDASARLGGVEFDILLSGFSSGGSMAWHFACYSKTELGAVVSVAGGLRRPIPSESCPGGARRLLQIHGFSDGQVPLEGRSIRDWHQGDVFEGLALMRKTNLCRSQPDEFSTDGPFWCRTWTSCETGMPIRFCLHKGAHGLPKGWAERSIAWHRDQP